ncbi:hypothetical protein SEEE5646_07510 [Salmonella enterica subsp. enterica serovar Enteritidis str. 50-5646]|nr:hypothetical protein SEEE5646_07510 [Salmonella enterica subsp. enterica serovar Enteritidis str. 50-5646]
MMLLIFSAFMLRYFGKNGGDYRPYYICGFRVSARYDWRSLVHRYCGRVAHGYFDWPPLVADDPAQRPGDSAF